MRVISGLRSPQRMALRARETRTIPVMTRIDLRLGRFHKGARRIRKLTKDRLTADNDYLRILGNRTSSPNQVLKLGTRRRCVCAVAA